MLSKLSNLQGRMDELKNRLNNVTVKGEAPGGTVIATVNCNKEVKDINIRYDLIEEGDKDRIQDLVTIAINRAMAKAQEVADNEGAAISKEMLPNMPVIPGMPGLA